MSIELCRASVLLYSLDSFPVSIAFGVIFESWKATKANAILMAVASARDVTREIMPKLIPYTIEVP
jgi:hypothetical protein